MADTVESFSTTPMPSGILSDDSALSYTLRTWMAFGTTDRITEPYAVY